MRNNKRYEEALAGYEKLLVEGKIEGVVRLAVAVPKKSVERNLEEVDPVRVRIERSREANMLSALKRASLNGEFRNGEPRRVRNACRKACVPRFDER